MRRFNKIFGLVAALVFVIALVPGFLVKADYDYSILSNTDDVLYASEIQENSSTGYRAIIIDQAGLFSQYEAKELLEEAYPITEYGDMFVLTIPKDGNPFGSSESATSDYCEAVYGKVSQKSNCVMFAIDMDTRYIYVYSAGSTVESNLSGSKSDSITDNCYSYASDGDYYGCASKGISQILKVLANMHIAEPMKVVSNLFIAFVCGFVIMYLVALSKSKVSTPSDDEMLKYAAIRFAANNPKDTVTGTTKTYCPRSSGSSGGRSGGGGGGGHSHSGGGHRF